MKEKCVFDYAEENFNILNLNFDRLGKQREVIKKAITQPIILFDKLEPIRKERLLELAKLLKKGERSVFINYISSKLKDNEDNRKFLDKFVNAVRDKSDFDIGEELKRAFGCLGKNYKKTSVEKSKNYNKLKYALWSTQRYSKLHKGIREKWDKHLETLGWIENKERREAKIKECKEAKQFLEERDLIDYLPDAVNGIEVCKSLKLMEETAGLKITSENYKVEELGEKIDMIKGKGSDKGMLEFERCFMDYNKKNDFELLAEIPKTSKCEYGEFGFTNRGNKKFTKICYDVETNEKQEAVLIGVLNKDMKRIVLGEVVTPHDLVHKYFGKNIDYKFEKSYKNGYEIIRCRVMNGWEAVFLADSETYLASCINSQMRQGDNTPSELKDIIKNVDINFDYVKEILSNKRRSFWIAHNSNFDINKLNLTAKNDLKHIGCSKVKNVDLVVNSFGNTKRVIEYSYKLGNRSVGVDFKASTRKYGLFDKPEVTLSPIQRESDNYVYALDSLLIAKALQKKDGSLKGLGEEFNLKIKKGESDYRFSGVEIWDKKKKSVNEVEYLLKDLFVTDSVFSNLCMELDVIPDLLGSLGIDKQRIKKHSVDAPYLYRIFSTASLTKLFYTMKNSEDYDDWKVKNSNMKFYDNINDLFKEVYSGGRVEIFKHGIIKDKKIIYSDFASLYPHTSYLCNVESLMSDLLDKKLDFISDREMIEKKFFEMVGNIASKIKNKQPLEKSDFSNSAVLNVSSYIDLRLSRRASVYRGKVKTDINKRSRCDLILENSKFNTSIYDLCYAVLEKHLIDNVSLEELREVVRINKGLMVIPSSKTDKSNDMHTKLYDKRNEITKEIKKLTDITKIKHLKNQSQFIKIILNAGYGITAEFKNEKAGQFYNPILASSITAMARLLNNLIEINTKYEGFEVYYGDTDSCFMDCEGYYKVADLFKNVCELKNELPENVFINNMCVLGAKEYAYFTNDKNEYSVKTHGVGYRARGYKPVLDILFRDYIKNGDKKKAISNAVKEAPLLKNFNFSHIYARSGNSTMYSNLARIVNKRNECLGEYKGFKVYQYGKNDLFITDCENITKGTFGKMFRLDEPKIYFFSVKYGFNETMLKDVIKNIEGIPEEKRKLVLQRIKNKFSEKMFLERYLNKNEDNVKRQILENGDTKPFSVEVSEDININFNEKKLKLDGVEYFGMCDLPDFDFSSKMEADLSSYYSKSIASMSKSLSYWFAKQSNPENADKVFDKRSSELLIPQKNNFVMIPLNMVEVPESEAIVKLRLEEKEKIKLLDKYYWKNKTGQYVKLKKGYDFEEIKDILLTALKPRNTIITEIFNNKKYWFEMTSYKSNKHNAVLRVNVVVGNPCKLKVYLWINPTPFYNVDLWESSYTDLMLSSESINNVIEKVFSIAFDRENKKYNSILSGFSRGSSLSVNDLRKNPRYFLDICYTMACSFIIMNGIKHTSLRIGRLDLSKNIEMKVNKNMQDYVTAFLQTSFKNEVDKFIEYKSKNDFVKKIKMSEDIYTAGSGHYSGLINKSTKISQVVYNKSRQLDYKLIKASRKKGFNSHMIKKLEENKGKYANVWRLEVQAYGYKAIEKSVNCYDMLMKKLGKCLKISVKIVNGIDKSIIKVNVEYVEKYSAFTNWFNDKLLSSLKPPNLMTVLAR